MDNIFKAFITLSGTIGNLTSFKIINSSTHRRLFPALATLAFGFQCYEAKEGERVFTVKNCHCNETLHSCGCLTVDNGLRSEDMKPISEQNTA